MNKGVLTLLFSCLLISACELGNKDVPRQNRYSGATDENKPLFSLVPSSKSNVKFVNRIADDYRNNVYDFVNVYNGGGVAIGDINNDGLSDIFFTGNNSSNRLYLNKGNFVFEDISVSAKILEKGWSTGVTMADVNGDGFIDIYVCRGFSDETPALRKNLMYINNGDLTFTEAAESFGIADGNHSVQALFFDYNLDGKLDLFVGNHPREFIIRGKHVRFQKRKDPPIEESDRLFTNKGDGTFSESTIKAGILNHGFTLGIVSSDFNNDNWPDIYVAVDHSEPDVYYMNNGDGTFSDETGSAFKHISNSSMGIDAADINNDAWVDIIELDMLAQDNFRQKTQMSGMNPEKFWQLVRNNFHYQYMRNTLHLNNGIGNFSEIGQLSGISNTDWSWAALVADFDNDGFKDLYACNGYRRDFRDNDFSKNKDKYLDSYKATTREELLKKSYGLTSKMPSTPLINYYFKNNGDLTFSNHSTAEGITTPSFSSGAAYGDLDNDGDLDLVISNVDAESFIYENHASEKNGNNNLRIKLFAEGPNKTAIGTKLFLKTEDGIQYQEYNLTRGFQSSVEAFVHFGLNKLESADELKIVWPDKREQVLQNVDANQVIACYQKDAVSGEGLEFQYDQVFTETSDGSLVDFVHAENEYDDYEKEVLLPHKMSHFGPALATGDVNGDGLIDFYIGGASGQGGALYTQLTEGKFSKTDTQVWDADALHEDLGATLFDSDNDGDLDLYVVSGGNELPAGNNYYQDRLYLNTDGNFEKSTTKIPKNKVSGSCVVSGDIDGDGDLDLFVAGRQDPANYPFPVSSSILINNRGSFTDETSQIAPELHNFGMVTSATWTDYDGDSDNDLVVVGEWMPISLFENENGRLKHRNIEELENSTGWWNKVIAADMDGDGDEDYILGNLGLNYKYKASEKEPFHVYAEDFDENGSKDIVLGYYNDGKCYPLRGRQCSSEQIPKLLDQFPSYKDFAQASIEEVYGEGLESALHYTAQNFSSSYLENLGSGKFKLNPLPTEAQFSTVRGIVARDFNADGHQDLLLSGNFYWAEVETGRADASVGVYMLGDGKGNFNPMPAFESGFNAHLDARDMAVLVDSDNPLIIVVNNNDRPQFFSFLGNKSESSSLTTIK